MAEWIATFGRWLKLRRRGLGLTQAQLGEQISYAGETGSQKWRPMNYVPRNRWREAGWRAGDRTGRADGIYPLCPAMKGRQRCAGATVRPRCVTTRPRGAGAGACVRNGCLCLTRSCSAERELTVIKVCCCAQRYGPGDADRARWGREKRLALQAAANLATMRRWDTAFAFLIGVYVVPLCVG
ncbi:MAG: hypothetical protein R3E79_40250 [Caldilineaceae bacterium]